MVPGLWLALFSHHLCNGVLALSTSCSTIAEGAENQHGQSSGHQHPDDLVSLLQTSVSLQTWAKTIAKVAEARTSKLISLSRGTWQGEDLNKEDHDSIVTQSFNAAGSPPDVAGHPVSVVGVFGRVARERAPAALLEAAETENAVDTSMAEARQEAGKAKADVKTSSMAEKKTHTQKTKLILLRDPHVVYNHLPKAGGSFVRHVLNHAILHENLVIESEFQSLSRQDREVAFTIGSIRNPCDYYVSLWAFRNSKGYYTKQEAKMYYGVSPYLNTTEDLEHFSKWLRHIMPNGKPGLESFLLALSYSPRGVPKQLGTSSRRQLRKIPWSSQNNSYNNAMHDTQFRNMLQETIEAFDTSSVDCWVKTEDLKHDLERCLQAYEKSTGAAVVDWAKFKEAVTLDEHGDHQNTSPHQPCAFYYNDASKAFVQNSDQAIFEKFDYDTCCAPLQL